MKQLLDNPIYNSLLSGHLVFSNGTENAKYYSKDIALFAGLKDNSAQDFELLYLNSPSESRFIVFTPAPVTIPDQWKQVAQIDMFQMVYAHEERLGEDDTADFTDLDQSNVPEMTALVELTKPGPFGSRTIELGNYTGVFHGKELIAMAGHRFNPTPYTEISAVCTHPDHLGKGHAFRLIREQIKRIRKKSEIPFLHVRRDNHPAIGLYQKLGFSIRTEMIAYIIQKTTG